MCTIASAWLVRTPCAAEPDRDRLVVKQTYAVSQEAFKSWYVQC